MKGQEGGGLETERARMYCVVKAPDSDNCATRLEAVPWHPVFYISLFLAQIPGERTTVFSKIL